MGPWDLLGYLLIFLLVAVGAALINVRIVEWKNRNLKYLQERLDEVEQKYNQLVTELNDLKIKRNKLRAEYTDLKKMQDLNLQKQAPSQEEEDKEEDPLEHLKRQGVISEDQIEKAKQYLEKNDNTGFSLEDSMVLLGYLDPEKLNDAKKKVQTRQ